MKKLSAHAFVSALGGSSVSLSILSVYSCWPSSRIRIDWKKEENGSLDDWRDVDYAYYQYDTNYLYLKIKCYALPNKE